MPWTCAIVLDEAFSVDIQAPGWYFVTLSVPPGVQVGARQLSGLAKGCPESHARSGPREARTELFEFKYSRQAVESETMFVLRSAALYTPFSSCEIALGLRYHEFPRSGFGESGGAGGPPPPETFKCLTTKRLRLVALGAPCVHTHVESFEYMNYMSLRFLIIWGYSEGGELSGTPVGLSRRALARNSVRLSGGAAAAHASRASREPREPAAGHSPSPVDSPSPAVLPPGPGVSTPRAAPLGDEGPVRGGFGLPDGVADPSPGDPPLSKEPQTVSEAQGPAVPQGVKLGRAEARRMFLRLSKKERPGKAPAASRRAPYGAWEALFRRRREENEEYCRRYRQRCARATKAYFTRVLSGSPYASAFDEAGTSRPATEGRPGARRESPRVGDTEPLLPLRQDTPHNLDVFLQALAGNRGLRSFLLAAGLEKSLSNRLVGPATSRAQLAAKHAAKAASRELAQQDSAAAQRLVAQLSSLQEAGLGEGLRPGISLASTRKPTTFKEFWGELTATRDRFGEARYSSHAYVSKLIELRAQLDSVQEVGEFYKPVFLVWDERGGESEGKGAGRGGDSADRRAGLSGASGVAEARGGEAGPVDARNPADSGATRKHSERCGSSDLCEPRGPSSRDEPETLALPEPVAVQEMPITNPVSGRGETSCTAAASPRAHAQTHTQTQSQTQARPPDHAMTPVDVYVFFHGYRGISADLRYVRDRIIEVEHCREFLQATWKAGGRVASPPRVSRVPLLSEDSPPHDSRYILLKGYEGATTESVLLQAELAAREILRSLSDSGLVFLTKAGDAQEVSQRLRRVHFIAHSQGCVVAEAVLFHRALSPLLPLLHKFVAIQGPNFGMYTKRRIVRLGFRVLALRKREISLRELALQRLAIGVSEGALGDGSGRGKVGGAGEVIAKSKQVLDRPGKARPTDSEDAPRGAPGNVSGGETVTHASSRSSRPSRVTRPPSSPSSSLLQNFEIPLTGKGCLLGMMASVSRLHYFKEVFLFGSYNDGYVHPFSSLALQTPHGDAETVAALARKYRGVSTLRRALISYDERELKARHKLFDRMTKRTGHIKPLVDYWAVCGVVGLM